jgi:hypothetical protein
MAALLAFATILLQFVALKRCFRFSKKTAHPKEKAPNALRIRVARVRINHLRPQKAATQFCVELSREWGSLGV